MKLNVVTAKQSNSVNLNSPHDYDQMDTNDVSKIANMTIMKLLSTVGKKITASVEIKRNLLIRKAG